MRWLAPPSSSRRTRVQGSFVVDEGIEDHDVVKTLIDGADPGHGRARRRFVRDHSLPIVILERSW
jgi:hypothetical protein